MRGALHNDLLPKLFDAALHPVQFRGFLDASVLEYQVEALEERMLEFSARVGLVASTAVVSTPSGSTPRASSGSSASSSVPQSKLASAIRERSSADPDASRWEVAHRLQKASGGRTLRQCFYALQIKHDDPDEALMWLITTSPAAQIASEETTRESTRTDAAVVEGLEVDQPLITSGDDGRAEAAGGAGGNDRLGSDRLLVPLEFAITRPVSAADAYGLSLRAAFPVACDLLEIGWVVIVCCRLAGCGVVRPGASEDGWHRWPVWRVAWPSPRSPLPRDCEAL